MSGPAPLMGSPTDPVIPWGTLPVSDDRLRDAAWGYPSRSPEPEFCAVCGATLTDEGVHP